jgi:hypothetical protein
MPSNELSLRALAATARARRLFAEERAQALGRGHTEAIAALHPVLVEALQAQGEARAWVAVIELVSDALAARRQAGEG